MNIREAKEEIIRTIKAYTAVDEDDQPVIPISAQRPLLLMGPPGIGKTAVMEQASKACGVGLLSYTITHHTRQSAVGLPELVHRTYGEKEYTVTQYTMSEIIGSVYEYMERTGHKKGILFIDEINCVSETLAPTMLQFLQCKSFGNQKIPEGWIIVAAGNPPEYNKSVRDFDVVTLDRVKKIDVEPDFGVWKEYAYQVGIHGAVISYLELKKENFYHMETRVDGKRFATARGWQDLSELLTVYEKLGMEVDQEVIFQYIQQEKIAKDFANYLELYKKYQTDYQIQGILKGEVKEAVYEKLKFAPFDERLSVIGLLLAALSERFEGAYEADLFVSELFERLKAFKRQLHDSNVPAELLEAASGGMFEKAEADRENGTLDRKTEHLQKKVAGVLQVYAKLLKEENILDEQAAFERVRTEFVKETKVREAVTLAAGECLEYAFDFMERAFGESQEMVVFITELTVNFYGAKFLSENECARFYKYNKGLLANERRAGILSGIEEVEMLMNGN